MNIESTMKASTRSSTLVIGTRYSSQRCKTRLRASSESNGKRRSPIAMVKAVVFKALGDSDVLQVIEEYQLPPKQEGEVQHAMHVLVPSAFLCLLFFAKWNV